MVKNVLPTCHKCGASVIDFVEPEVEKEGKIKKGKFVDNVWICDDCIKK
jgi:uncharacterized protein with PIN domain